VIEPYSSLPLRKGRCLFQSKLRRGGPLSDCDLNLTAYSEQRARCDAASYFAFLAPNYGFCFEAGGKIGEGTRLTRPLRTTQCGQPTRAGNFGDFAFHERYHFQYWEQLVKQSAVPGTEYDRYLGAG
jgi:hypothetical protein